MTAVALKPKPSWRGDPTFMPEVLRAFGVKVAELPGWLNRGHGDFNIIQGLIVHHTGHNKTSADYIARHPQLGLCSQIHLDRAGLATMCGVGIAYHAGLGSKEGWPTNAANFNTIGIEAQSDGTSVWPDAQMDAYHRLCAAILWYLGKDATPYTLISHAEYSALAQGKWDPGSGRGVPGEPINMNWFRSKVQYYIDNPPFMKSADEIEEEELVSILNEVHQSIVPGSKYEAQLKQMIVNADGHSYIARITAQDNQRRLEALEKKISEQDKLLARIAAKIGA